MTSISRKKVTLKVLRGEYWYYLPEKSTPFFRVGLPGNISDHVCPSGCSSLSLEYGLGERFSIDGDLEELVCQTLDYLSVKGVLRWDSIEVIDSHLISPAYIAHRLQVTPALLQLASELESQGIFLAGRYGAWDYFSLEDAWLSGAEAAEKILRFRKSESVHNESGKRHLSCQDQSE